LFKKTKTLGTILTRLQGGVVRGVGGINCWVQPNKGFSVKIKRVILDE